MQTTSRILVSLILMLLASVNVWALQVKAYVAPFSVTGAANKDELKPALQSLLMTRLNDDSILTVDSAESADIIISGSYIAFGKIFSIDAAAKNRSGSTLVRAFEQGESQEDIFQAIGKVANALKSGINKSQQQTAASAVIPVAAKPALTAVPVDIVRPEPAKTVATASAIIKPDIIETSGDIVRTESVKRSGSSAWVSQRLEGEQIGLAAGRSIGEKGRELFIAGKHSLQYFLLGKEMILQAQATLPVNQDIIAIDSADLDGDGVSEIYLTIFNGENLASQVWSAEGKSLKKVADNLPYFFRAVTVQGKKTLYAQQIDKEANYYGGLAVVVKKGAAYELTKPVKLPSGYNINNVSVISPPQNKAGFVGLNNDGYLLVFDELGAELWRSSEKLGGSETYYSKSDMKYTRETGLVAKKVFLEQRIMLTKNGEIVVPKNDGMFNIGDMKGYTKNSIYAFRWNGASLDETWHTRQSQNYLVDYIYDEESKELLLLEVVKKAGIMEKGASALFIKKVE